MIALSMVSRVYLPPMEMVIELVWLVIEVRTDLPFAFTAHTTQMYGLR